MKAAESTETEYCTIVKWYQVDKALRHAEQQVSGMSFYHHILRWVQQEGGIYLNCNSHEGPAGIADVALLSTSPHIIIVCQIYIKHQLALHRRKYPVSCQACEGAHSIRLACITGSGA